MNKTIGFIILRHVGNEDANKYWKFSYQQVRKYYPDNWIMILDDNSDYSVLDVEFQKLLYNTKIVNSEFHKRAELLPYYYYLHHKLFDTAVIIHDSAFINSKLDFNVERFKMIWEFDHYWDQIEDETNLISQLNNNENLLEFHKNKMAWKGCFGAMSIVTHDYLVWLDNKYDLSKLLPHVTTRHNRMSFERVIACILQADAREDEKKSLLGNIHYYCNFETKFEDMYNLFYLPIIKLEVRR